MSHKASLAIRRFCLDCQGGHAPSVRDCADGQCILYPVRHAPGDEPETSALPSMAGGHIRPVRLIRLFCLVCAGNRQEVRSCDAREGCALWSFRFGVSPSTFKRVTARRQFRRALLTLPGLTLPVKS